MDIQTHGIIDNAVILADSGAYNPGIHLRLDSKSMTVKNTHSHIYSPTINPQVITRDNLAKLLRKDKGCCADFSIYLMFSAMINSPVLWASYFPQGPRSVAHVVSLIVSYPISNHWARGYASNSFEFFPTEDLSAANQAYVLKRLVTKDGY